MECTYEVTSKIFCVYLCQQLSESGGKLQESGSFFNFLSVPKAVSFRKLRSRRPDGSIEAATTAPPVDLGWSQAGRGTEAEAHKRTLAAAELQRTGGGAGSSAPHQSRPHTHVTTRRRGEASIASRPQQGSTKSRLAAI